MKKVLVSFITTLFFLVRCTGDVQPAGTTMNGNIATTISSDTALLGDLIDLKRFPPTRVKYKYVYVNNSGENERLSIPGPSDGFLQAVLYFDDSTFARLLEINLKHSGTSAAIKTQYEFDWLDDSVKTELAKPGNGTTEFPPTFFQSPPLLQGGYIVLDKKIILKLADI